MTMICGGWGGVVKRPGIKTRQGRTQRVGRGSLGLDLGRVTNGWRSSFRASKLRGACWGRYEGASLGRPRFVGLMGRSREDPIQGKMGEDQERASRLRRPNF
jgi:hypothetical protein